MTVAEGEMAPDFEMPATGGRTVSLSGYKGKPFILIFLPQGRHTRLHEGGMRVPGGDAGV